MQFTSTTAWNDRILLVGVLWLTVISGLNGDERPAVDRREPVRHNSLMICEDLPFCEVKGQTLRLDLARPTESTELLPGVICIHGGAWVSGTRKTMTIYEEIAACGFVAIRVDYRLAPKHRFPAQIHDMKCAVRWMRAHAKKYRIDSAHIGVVGYSAGGHLATLLATTNGNPDYEGETGYCKYSSRVQGVVTHFGVTDLNGLYQQNVIENRFGEIVRFATCTTLGALLGGPANECPERYEEASPIRLVNDQTPPLLITHGTKDWMLDPDQAIHFARAAERVGVETELFLLKGASHGYGSGDGGRFGKWADEQTIRFLSEQLKPTTIVRNEKK